MHGGSRQEIKSFTECERLKVLVLYFQVSKMLFPDVARVICRTADHKDSQLEVCNKVVGIWVRERRKNKDAENLPIMLTERGCAWNLACVLFITNTCKQQTTCSLVSCLTEGTDSGEMQTSRGKHWCAAYCEKFHPDCLQAEFNWVSSKCHLQWNYKWSKKLWLIIFTDKYFITGTIFINPYFSFMSLPFQHEILNQ